MSKLIIKKKKIIENIKKIKNYLDKKKIKFTVVSKILSGNKKILTELIKEPIFKKIHSIGDSRLSNLKTIKEINPKIKTMYIKPPSIKDVNNIVKYADISLNTSLQTIKELNICAKKQNRIHEIIIMIELGEIREGVLRKNLVDFYQKVFKLENIKISGIGTNLGCMYGIEPTFDKMIQLSLYKELLETKFNKKINIISGGSSITLSLVNKRIPPKINHFRIGEAVFMGTNPLTGKKYQDLSTDAFSYEANIIELKKKSNKPEGKISAASIGHISETKSKNKESYRAIVDFGILDVNAKELKPKNKNTYFIGTTSDMSVFEIDIPEMKTEKNRILKFTPNYMAVARLLNSKYTKIEIK